MDENTTADRHRNDNADAWVIGVPAFAQPREWGASFSSPQLTAADCDAAVRVLGTLEINPSHLATYPRYASLREHLRAYAAREAAPIERLIISCSSLEGLRELQLLLHAKHAYVRHPVDGRHQIGAPNSLLFLRFHIAFVEHGACDRAWHTQYLLYSYQAALSKGALQGALQLGLMYRSLLSMQHQIQRGDNSLEQREDILDSSGATACKCRRDGEFMSEQHQQHN